MEGRTIARPNPPPRPREPRRKPCFNGGPDNCPAKPGDRAGRRAADLFASMEGRTIARPNVISWVRCSHGSLVLQWRAGQLPGQTTLGPTTWRLGTTSFNGGPDNCPAKRRCAPTACRGRGSFNGGPDNCPAKRLEIDHIAQGQRIASMEGRTIARPNPARRRRWSRSGWGFNGGPDNCPAKPPARTASPRCRSRASMEGRTIARPNPSAPRRRRRRCGCFNGGPDNCPAKPSAPPGLAYRL